ncbi:hypothetical protein PSU4_22840 [Pseudonocardia sulfidoxydans NBRC 16205]|uniref:ESX-1 secretion-associated protein n=1 Tax=Pseudonocardia sulfidoxydans NBRC 16205 TaxID=1223511 RepID=A0A511DEW3_9PSEU|nr:hypothetical protein [Pseudonocardia sulfidoxydans]GEL23330.1 hypothetical protein PSU4_22840 [Pseudonocardia sulfidoxydans NBRC 16205]
MSAGGFSVDADAVEAHAGTVEERAGRVRAGAQAGKTVGPGAFGLIGQGISKGVITASHELTTTLGAVAGTGERHGQSLRDTVACYREVERRVAAGFGGPR